MKTYIYPQNLKAASRLWLWSIRDFLLICLGLILSVLILTQIWSFSALCNNGDVCVSEHLL